MTVRVGKPMQLWLKYMAKVHSDDLDIQRGKKKTAWK